MAARTLFFLLVSLSLVGCRAAQLGRDQGSMRDTLLGLYEDQVFDNLVRAKLNYPIVQIDYSNLTGTLTQAANTTVGGSETDVHNTYVAGAMGALLKKVSTSIFNYSVGASENAQMTMTGQPVIATDSVYKAYVDEVNKNPDIVKRVTGKPDLADAHLTHEFLGEKWYVPKDKAGDFFRLYLATTVQRQVKVVVPLNFKTTLLSTVNIDRVTNDMYTLEIRLKDKIPNDTGQIIIPVNGVEMKFRYQRVEDVDAGELTDRVLLIYSEKDKEGKALLPVAEFVKAIAGQDVILKNDAYVPGYVAPVRNQLEEIRSQLELQRLQQQIGR